MPFGNITAEVYDLIASLGLEADGYADDTQVRCSGPAHQQSDLVRRLAAGIVRIREWFADNRLRLNEDKTQVIWLGTQQQLNNFAVSDLDLPSAKVPVSSAVKNLGVTFDRCMTMADHVASLSRTCFFQLRQLRTVRSSLSLDAAKTLTQAFICSRQDYCNNIHTRISKQLLQRLQCVQNAAARFVTGERKFDHITPVLSELHWLPVQKRILFKVGVVFYKWLHTKAPSYLTEMCTSSSSLTNRPRLRSADSDMMAVPRTRTAYGDRGFNAAGPRMWNSLPADLRDPSISLEMFRRGLKTFLFSQS